jgi:hypothetical protein
MTSRQQHERKAGAAAGRHQRQEGGLPARLESLERLVGEGSVPFLDLMLDAAEPDRTVLPLAEPPRQMSTELDVRNATPPPRFEVKAPEGAPNVLLILIDDLGFAGTSAFGGPVATPNFDQVAREGIIYNNFHTQSTCSPTRAALLSGRNPHVANMGGITEAGTAFPGHTAQIPNEVAPLAEMLRLNGFSTAAFGKWHQTPPWETSISGPFDRWPTSQGFDKFYGFMGFSTNHWAPAIIDGTVAHRAAAGSGPTS